MINSAWILTSEGPKSFFFRKVERSQRHVNGKWEITESVWENLFAEEEQAKYAAAQADNTKIMGRLAALQESVK